MSVNTIGVLVDVIQLRIFVVQPKHRGISELQVIEIAGVGQDVDRFLVQLAIELNLLSEGEDKGRRKLRDVIVGLLGLKINVVAVGPAQMEAEIDR